MKITYDLDLETFEAWSGAVDTLKRVRNAGKCAELEAVLEELYPDGMSETGLNDLLWFEPESVYEWVGIRSDTAIRKELEAKEEELEALQDEWADAWEEELEEINSRRELHGLNEISKENDLEEYNGAYQDFSQYSGYLKDYADLMEEIDDLKEELANW